jgi:hypothetical protein
VHGNMKRIEGHMPMAPAAAWLIQPGSTSTMLRACHCQAANVFACRVRRF